MLHVPVPSVQSKEDGCAKWKLMQTLGTVILEESTEYIVKKVSLPNQSGTAF